MVSFKVVAPTGWFQTAAASWRGRLGAARHARHARSRLGSSWRHQGTGVQWDTTNNVIQNYDWLVVFRLPLWKMMEFVNGKDDIPYMKWKKKKCYEPPTRFEFCIVLSQMSWIPRVTHMFYWLFCVSKPLDFYGCPQIWSMRNSCLGVWEHADSTRNSNGSNGLNLILPGPGFSEVNQQDVIPWRSRNRA